MRREQIGTEDRPSGNCEKKGGTEGKMPPPAGKRGKQRRRRVTDILSDSLKGRKNAGFFKYLCMVILIATVGLPHNLV